MLNEMGVLLLSSICVPAAAGGVADAPFVQEYHEPFAIGEDADANDVRAIAVDLAGNVWAATKAGVFSLEKGARDWQGPVAAGQAGPAFDIDADASGTVWVAAWNGVYRATAAARLEKVEGIDQPVTALHAGESEVLAAGPDGLWRMKDGHWTTEPLRCSQGIRAVLCGAGGGVWLATAAGLYHHGDGADRLYQAEGEIVSCDVRDAVHAADGCLWAAGLGGVTVYKDGTRAQHFTPKEGLPSVYVQSVACGPDGRMWVGTDSGVSRYDGHTWSLRHSRRWLLSDDVRDVAFDGEGTAWVATSAGVSAIKRRMMTLADKAKYFHEVCMARHVRAPGLVEKCWLETPGDLSTWRPEDDDNDGQYTAMYLAMESYRYAATKDPEAAAKAKKAFEALRFLHTVTETAGFVARTVIPPTWDHMHDPNRTYTEREAVEARARDPRYKPVEVRWRPSSDGKWLWKGDTSSDEITGHFWGYKCYYDLVADEAERAHVAGYVRKVMDYIIDGGYVLNDIDGTHTRWAVWSPEKLNHDPDWAAERGINSVEILSYLKTTYHMTGDDKYQQEYLRLLHGQDYANNVRRAKTFAPAWRTHIDDELLALAYPALLEYEKDPAVVALYRESLVLWYNGVRHDRSPFMDYVYGALAGSDPQPDHAVSFLRDVPLDLIRWRIDNTQREDLERVRAPEIEPLQTDRLPPASERGVMRWDNNPWSAVQGDGGHTESDGVFWLLPYWMGRYHGFVRPAD